MFGARMTLRFIAITFASTNPGLLGITKLKTASSILKFISIQ